jgi:hypothetical protein
MWGDARLLGFILLFFHDGSTFVGIALRVALEESLELCFLNFSFRPSSYTWLPEGYMQTAVTLRYIIGQPDIRNMRVWDRLHVPSSKCQTLALSQV